MPKKVTTTEAKTGFLEILAEVTQTKQRFSIVRRGKPVAAIVPYSDLERLESQTTNADLKEAQKMMDRIRKKKESTSPLSEVADRLEKSK